MGFFDSFNQATRTDNAMSPFGEAGLLGDPLHYIVGDKYDNFMRKTWEKPNEFLGNYLTKFDKFDRKINPIHRAIDRTPIGGKIADFVHNKPGDSALAILGSIFGGGALLGGMGGGGAVGGGSAAGGSGGGGLAEVGSGGIGSTVGDAAGSGYAGGTIAADGSAAGYGSLTSGGGGLLANSGMGIFANNGAAGMAGVGGGNAGTLAASNGLGGGAGIGSASAPSSIGIQDYLKMAQSLGGQQQQQPAPVQQAPPAQQSDAFKQLLAQQSRAQALRRKLNRTPQENQELRDLTQGLLSNA